jgi:hypothetical protein
MRGKRVFVKLGKSVKHWLYMACTYNSSIRGDAFCGLAVRHVDAIRSGLQRLAQPLTLFLGLLTVTLHLHTHTNACTALETAQRVRTYTS